MDFFEFLIQREGDRSWLPLESSETEILEGRYRIIGRSPYVKQPVDIRISYLDLESVPPRRRMHKRTSRTNEKGLVAILPFTALRNGKWGVQCAGMGPGSNGAPKWQHNIQLQVLEDNAHHVVDFEPEYAADAPVNSTLVDSTHPFPQAEKVRTAEDLMGGGEQAQGNKQVWDDRQTWRSAQPQGDEQQDSQNLNCEQVQPAGSAGQTPNTPEGSQQKARGKEQPQGEAQHDIADEQGVTAQADAKGDNSRAMPGQALPTGLPIDLDSLAPDIRDDIAHVFQAVDAMAEDILASIGMKMAERSDVQGHIQPEEDAGQDAGYNADAEGVHANGFSLPQQQFPSLQLVLDQDAWPYQGDRPLTVTGQVQPLGENPAHDELSSMLLSMRLTDPQNGSVLGEITESIYLRQQESTPFRLNLDTIHSTQAHVVLGEVVLAIPVAQGNASKTSASENTSLGSRSFSAESGIIIASQAFVVTVDMDSLLGAMSIHQIDNTSDSADQLASESANRPSFDPPLPFVDATEQPAASDNADPPEPRPFRVSDQPALPPKIHGESSTDSTASPSPYPPLDLPDFVKSPTSLASSLLELAGLSSDARERVGEFPSVELNEAVEEESDQKGTVDEVAPGVGTGQTPEAWLERLMQELKQADQSGEAEVNAGADPFAATDLDDDSPGGNHSYEDSPLGNDLKTDNPFSKAVQALDATTDLTDHETVDPFDLLDESELALGKPTPSAASPSGKASKAKDAENIPSPLAQQFIPDYADDPSDFERRQEFLPPLSPDLSDSTEILVDDDPWSEGSRDGAMSSENRSANASVTKLEGYSPSSMGHHPMNGTHPAAGDRGMPDRTDTPAQERYSAFPDDVEIPTPTLECMDEELVAGQAFCITAKIPDLGPRAFVKLWIQDRQTRALLDGPRWLADFIPGDEGTLEARTQMTIPLGAVQVRVEAIAMEMMTQRESRKVSLDKTVVPPDMPTFSLDDL